MNPELRQTFNTISRNLESANEVAQENIFTFTELVIDPCVNGFRSCLTNCTAACFPQRDDRLRRRRAQSRGRSDLHFDFYDDWDDGQDESYRSGPWGNDELDSLLAGRGSISDQPGRQRAMSYGARNRRPAHAPGEEDPNIIPSSAYLGFLERFKWRPGARGLRYKPSAADLREHPGTNALARDEGEPLIEESEEDEHLVGNIRKHRRQRSDTEASRSTTTSLSSRGDLIMGDEEEDAQPLDDEFAVMLTRQNTSSSRRPGLSRKSTRTASSKSSKSGQTKRSNSSKSLQPIAASPILERRDVEPPSMATLRAEEDHLRREEEKEVSQKREVAARLAKERGLDNEITSSDKNVAIKTLETTIVDDPGQDHQILISDKTSLQSPTHEIEERLGLASPISSAAGYHADSETEPFPSFPTSPITETRNFDHPP